jgi:hypothetical protein
MNIFFDSWFWVHTFSGSAIFFILFLAVKARLNEQKNRREKLSKEMDHSEAEKFSKKLRDSRVEMGVRKPTVFKTKRKLQKGAKNLDKKG